MFERLVHSTEFRFGFSSVINPSRVYCNGIEYLSFRQLSDDSSQILGSRLVIRKQNKEQVVNLDEYFHKYHIIVRDPKLFCHNDKVYLTFNSGYSETQNDVYLADITLSGVGNTRRLNITGRTNVEKNIIFASISEGDIKIIYRPFSQKMINANQKNNEIRFSVKNRDASTRYKKLKRILGDKVFKIGFGFGSQLVKVDKRWLVSVNYKIYFFGKRIYLPRIYEVKIEENDELSWIPCSSLLFHTLKDLLGQKYKFNKNLISCVYSSCIVNDGENTILLYGLNDQKAYEAPITCRVEVGNL